MNRIRESMEEIKASEELKRKTLNYVEEQRRMRLYRRKRFVPQVVLAAACLFFILTAGGYSIYKKPISYISIDVNPSVELGINRFGRVVSVEGYNEDGKNVLEGLSLENLPYLQAIERLLENETDSGFLDVNSQLFFTVIAEEPETMIRQLKANKTWRSYKAFTYVSDESCREEAHRHEMSFGKYRAYLELSEYDESVTVEDCHGMTMKEIQNRIEGCKGHGNTEEGWGHSWGHSEQEKEGHGRHHGGHH